MKTLKASLVVALKELLQLIRDPLALFVGIVVPAIGLPIFGGVVYGYIARQMKVNATATINLGASTEDTKRYLDLGWKWFQNSEFATDDPVKLQRLAEELQFGSTLRPSEVINEKINDAPTFARWCRSVAESHRSNVAEASAELLAQEVPHPDLFQVVVKGIGSVNFTDPGIRGELRQMSEAARSAVENKAIDVYLSGRDTPSRASDGTLVQRFDWTVVYDATRPVSARAHSLVSRYLEICNDARVSKAKVPAQTTFDTEIDIGVGAPLRPGERLAIESMSIFGTFGLLILVLKNVFAFAIEFSVTERERKTIEPLLITAASRLSIAMGKYLAIVVASLISSVFTVLCLWLIMRSMISEEMFPYGHDPVMGTAGTILLLNVLLLPLVLGGGGVALATSFMAKSTRMATYWNNTVMWSMLALGVVMFVGVNASLATAPIPILGAMLLIKSVFNGRFDLLLFALAMTSSMLFALLGLWMTVFFSNRETVLYGV